MRAEVEYQPAATGVWDTLLSQRIDTAGTATLHATGLAPEIWQQVVDNLPGGVIVLNAKGTIIYANAASVSLFEQALVHQSWSDIIARCIAPENNPADLKLSNGKYIDMTTCPLGSYPGQIILVKDVTQANELKARINHYQRVASLGEMAAKLAHQIRTPLAAAFLYAKNLVQHVPEASQAHTLAEKLSNRLKHIEVQIKNMLLFVKPDATMHTTTFSLSAFVSSMTQMVNAHHSDHATVHLDADFGQEGLQLNGEPEILLGAIQNCVDNAVQATSQPITISLQIKSTQTDTVTISISDDGPGMSEDARARATEPFYTTKSQGTGLGLSVVNVIAQRFGGKLDLNTNEQGGLTVLITLPCHKEG